ncbi:DUF1018 domain-containing protein [Biomphalaria pfeifferi]|uniref:DUF1018 domain-containing protein n=1 Tax=Biomphalaria pfeifferi TaxID=112525 RepID=A0AAD8AQ80_BIOPF|nr:DUF1018 domain-containing protein [Biomphalaria pfeifferi]
MPRPNNKIRTLAQNKLMHGYAAKCGLSHDDLRDYASEISNGRTDHTSELYTHEAAEIIDRLQKIAEPQKTPRRTIQYRRRNAGVDQIVTADQLNLLNNLWFAKEGRTANGLEMLCNRIIKREKPRTTKECNKVIEAVKSMNNRHSALGFLEKNDKEAA